VHERVSRLEAQMLQETALSSAQTDWGEAAVGERPVCPNCGTALQSRGKGSERCRAEEDKRSHSPAAMEAAPTVRWGFSPLDEHLALPPGSLTPRQQEHLVHLASWMPFKRAAQMLEALTGVQVSEATARRQTEQAGRIYEELQNEASRRATNAKEQETAPPSKLAPLVPTGHVCLCCTANGLRCALWP